MSLFDTFLSGTISSTLNELEKEIRLFRNNVQNLELIPPLLINSWWIWLSKKWRRLRGLLLHKTIFVIRPTAKSVEVLYTSTLFAYSQDYHWLDTCPSQIYQPQLDQELCNYMKKYRTMYEKLHTGSSCLQIYIVWGWEIATTFKLFGQSVSLYNILGRICQAKVKVFISIMIFWCYKIWNGRGSSKFNGNSKPLWEISSFHIFPQQIIIGQLQVGFKSSSWLDI